MTAPARHTIRFANPADVDAVAQLLRAMDAYYGDPLPVLETYAAMAQATMSEQEGIRFAVKTGIGRIDLTTDRGNDGAAL